MRIWRQCCARFLKYLDGELSAHRREVIQKDFQCITCFEMVEQGLNRYSCAPKNGGAAMNFGIDGDQVCVHGQDTRSSGRVVYRRGYFVRPKPWNYAAREGRTAGTDCSWRGLVAFGDAKGD